MLPARSVKLLKADLTSEDNFADRSNQQHVSTKFQPYASGRYLTAHASIDDCQVELMVNSTENAYSNHALLSSSFSIKVRTCWLQLAPVGSPVQSSAKKNKIKSLNAEARVQDQEVPDYMVVSSTIWSENWQRLAFQNAAPAVGYSGWMILPRPRRRRWGREESSQSANGIAGRFVAQFWTAF
jgi:hypothetical protein